MPSGVDWAETTKETPRGTVAVKWSRTPGGDVEYALSIPEGSTATVKVPAGMTAVSTPANGDSLTLAAGDHTLRFSARK